MSRCGSAEGGSITSTVVRRDQLGELAGLGFHAGLGPVVNVWQITPLEIIGSEVIPAVAGL